MNSGTDKLEFATPGAEQKQLRGKFFKTTWLILGVLSGLAIDGCKPKEQVIANKVVESEQALITGQIFIVTKGRANVVLGDEKIALLDAHETRTYFNSKALEWSNTLAAAQLKVDQAARIYDALYKDYLEKLDAAKKYYERQNDFESSRTVSGEIRDLHKEKKSSTEKQQFDNALAAQARLWDEINWPSADHFWPSLDIATTDSEGRFKFVVPKSRANLNMMLFAKAARQVGDEKENYWWMVNVNLNGRKTEEFVLSNDNKDSSGVWRWFDDRSVITAENFDYESPMQKYMVRYTVKMEAAKKHREYQDWEDNLYDKDDHLPTPRTLERIKFDIDAMENILHVTTPEEIAAANAMQEKAEAAAKTKAAALKKAASDRALKSNQDDAAKGDSFGLMRMGERYRDGDGVEKDLAKAKEYLQKAADAGSPTAKEELSKLNQP